MINFSKFTLCHISNGAIVQDGFDTYAIREGGTEVWAATTGENLSQLRVSIPDEIVDKAMRQNEWDSAGKPPSNDSIETVGTLVSKGWFYSLDKASRIRGYIDYVVQEDMTPEEMNRYLWDVLKMEMSIQEPK